MSTRAQICVEDDHSKVYLYQHWDGDEIGESLQNALKKKWRWNDTPYLTRIIFDAMTETSHGEETGYGIASTPFGRVAYQLIVDTDNQTVTNKNKRLTFREFCELNKADLQEFCEHL